MPIIPNPKTKRMSPSASAYNTGRQAGREARRMGADRSDFSAAPNNQEQSCHWRKGYREGWDAADFATMTQEQ